MTGVPIQNFSIPADSDIDITSTIVSTVPGDTLEDSTVYWRVYEQRFGVVDPSLPPVIEKSSLSGGGVNILPSPPMTFVVTITREDVAGLLRNYYYEATVVDGLGSHVPVIEGILTVTATENRIT